MGTHHILSGQVKHCGGVVHYTAENFVACNRDLLPEEVLTTLGQCQGRVLQEMFPCMSFQSPSRPITMATKLKTRLSGLFRHISMSTPYFVQCLVPSLKASVGIDKSCIESQVHNMQLVEMLRFRLVGYPVRSFFGNFYQRYKIFSKSQSSHDDSTFRSQCQGILKFMQFDNDAWQLGATKLYLKEAELGRLEEKRAEARQAAAAKLQSFYRSNRFYR